MVLVGLTGGIASGKSLVSNAFAELGVPVIDADQLAREVVARGSEGLAKLAEHFGTGILGADDTLDRAALRALVFSDEENREKVNAILHPLIRQLADKRIAELASEKHHYAIYAIPLLVETGQQSRFDSIVVVDVPEHVQLERIVARDGGTAEQAQAILAAQAPREQRLAIADHVITNTASKQQTVEQVKALHALFMSGR